MSDLDKPLRNCQGRGLQPGLRSFSSNWRLSPIKAQPVGGPSVSRRFSLVSDTLWELVCHPRAVLLDPESECAPCRHQPAAGDLAQTKPDALVLEDAGWLPIWLPHPEESPQLT